MHPGSTKSAISLDEPLYRLADSTDIETRLAALCKKSGNMSRERESIYPAGGWVGGQSHEPAVSFIRETTAGSRH